ncbi:iron complex transport system permease protein [Rhodothalassium salexigens DSM 2132]|uniref:Iron complex transport system permease protein n=1 Tax=Rhodothalassium salexigens DSM 2132 TaxID=1188247 RepID=A0A4R2PKN6_RHOSA|nr:iron ABC transporter permease [Rhodothalassium salexigens]MBB4211503.1 iron complex transport system permease protein [Rhodothalassium salexigens DSM 2132]MBK1639740.1 ABC transporter permease [Rhodothalassium salexigens DSM 2132]TCP34565.1 iron complex transport system permease protein [Rhodothalassium salexigens DSM 2132]
MSIVAPPTAAARRALHARRIGLLCGALTVLSFVSLAVGPAAMGPGEALAGLVGAGDAVTNTIVAEIRLPRTLLAGLIGAQLGMAGAALQGFLRNPLAEPGLLGASNAAALGAVVALYFGLAGTVFFALPLLAAGGAVTAMLGLVLLSRLLPQQQPFATLTLVLCGIAVSSLAGALISLLLNLSPNPFAAMEISFWLLGSLEDRSLAHVALAAPAIAVGMAVLAVNGRALDALSLGEDAAATLGVDLAAVRTRLIVGIAVGVGGAVSVSGAIGFLGLVTPHLARLWFGAQPSRLLWPSALLGALILLGADMAVRVVPTNNELKLGVVTALIGAPFLIHLMIRFHRA